MGFDFTISISHILTFISSAVIVIWNFFHLKNKVDRAEEKAEAAMMKAIEAQAKADTLEKELLAKYASVEHVAKIEDRLTSQMDRIVQGVESIRQFLMERK